jgi:undecaprenyl-phosphate 4-deoxy-4-formamido-L-arabinose transferase
VKLSDTYSNIKGVNLAKNFGQHAALLAGYSYAKGDIVVSLDDDGQIAVEDTYKLIEHLDDGYDVVYGRYKTKKHNKFRNWGSELCRKMLICLADVPKDFYGSSFYVAKKYVIREMLKYKNSYVFLTGLVFRATDKVDSVYVGHRSRKQGDSGYTLGKLIALWVNGATTFSVKPLRMSALMGCIVAFCGLLFACFVIVKKIMNPMVEAGWSSLMSVTLILCGTILIVLGLLGEYVGRLYMSSNNTPQYVVREVSFQDNEEE